MRSPNILEKDLTVQGRAFSAHQTLLTLPIGVKKFKERTLFTVASAFALASYTEEQIRAQHPQGQNSKRGNVPPGIQRLEGNTRLLRSTALDVQNALRTLVKLPFVRSVTGHESARILGVAQALLNASSHYSIFDATQCVVFIQEQLLWRIASVFKKVHKFNLFEFGG